MRYIITGVEQSLFGGYYIKLYIENDGTITEHDGGWKRIVGHIESDGNVTDDSCWRKIVGHIESDGTITDNSAWRHILGHIEADVTITDTSAVRHILGHIFNCR